MGAKELKAAILQEAVSGKLVPQIASEGNARDLLEEIRKERGESLPLAPARKRSSATPSPRGKAPKTPELSHGLETPNGVSITEDEIPFDIPENWCWCRLGEILKEIIVPQRDKPKEFGGTIPWCRIEDRDGDFLNGTKSNQYVSDKTIQEMNLKVNPVGTVLSASSGASIGSILINTVECCTNQTFIGLVSGKNLLNNYLYYYLHSIIPKLKLMGSGTTLAYISREKYATMPFPLPPVAEQKRIVRALETILPVIDEYRKKEEELARLILSRKIL